MVLIVLFLLIFSGRNGKDETMVVHPVSFVSSVSVSGKVTAIQNADLGFDQSGRVKSINYNVGDVVKKGTIMASIDNSDLLASLMQKEANLEREQAKLASLRAGTKPEQIALYEQKFSDAGTAFVVAMKSAYLQAEDAVKNKADTLFSNGDSVNPTLNAQAQSDNEKRAIENDRLIIRDKLVNWKNTLTNISTSTSSVTNAKSVTTETLSQIKSFFDRLGTLTANLSVGSSGLSQTTIDTYRSAINAGAQMVSAAASTEQAAEANWNSARDSLALEKSGSTSQDIEAQAAAVKAAEADLNNARALLSKSLIVAPFDGVITRIDAKIGEIVSPSESQITIMSQGNFLIESFVPEINIASIKLNDRAKITLDAYGDDVHFDATVVSIDPAETMRDGVSTYRIKLQFNEIDERVKSGMTANVLITTLEKNNAIVVPQGIISSENGLKYVTIKNGNDDKIVEVTTGEISSLGQIEILAGLKDGDIVLLNPEK